MARIYLYPDAGQALVILGDDDKEKFDKVLLDGLKSWLSGDVAIMAIKGHDVVEVRHA